MFVRVATWKNFSTRKHFTSFTSPWCRPHLANYTCISASSPFYSSSSCRDERLPSSKTSLTCNIIKRTETNSECLMLITGNSKTILFHLLYYIFWVILDESQNELPKKMCTHIVRESSLWQPTPFSALRKQKVWRTGSLSRPQYADSFWLTVLVKITLVQLAIWDTVGGGKWHTLYTQTLIFYWAKLPRKQIRQSSSAVLHFHQQVFWLCFRVGQHANTYCEATHICQPLRNCSLIIPSIDTILQYIQMSQSKFKTYTLI